MIPSDLLKQHGAHLVSLAKGDTLFEQGESARHFHIVESGRIKMAAWNDEGREFVQGYFTEGQSFGEPPFFNRKPYPASAVAVEAAAVWRIGYDEFMALLRENFEIHVKLTEVLSGRLIYKSMMLTEMAVEEAEHRLATLIEYFRRSRGIAGDREYCVRFTRQQLADMTGLRVETVIRSIKAMEGRGRLRIEEGRIYWKEERHKHPDEE